MLVDNSLVAVVSLPAGCFNPYSGVKTSILILDKSLARQSNTIAFFKVENDGFGLGAQRRAIDKNDLPQVQAELAAYLQALRTGASTESILALTSTAQIVPKEKIAANGDYNLSGERYRESDARRSAFPLRRFEEVCTLEYGASLPKEKRVEGVYPVVGSNGVTGYHNEYLVEGPAIVVGRKGSAGEVTLIEKNCFPIDTTYYVKQINPAESDISFLYWLLKTLNLPELRGGAGIPGLNRTDVYETHQIPLPPLEVQKKIVAEIEGYQKVIDGARAVLDNYRPHIPIHPDWPMVELGEVCEQIQYGLSVPLKREGAGFKTFRMNEIIEGRCVDRGDMKRADISAEEFEKYHLSRGDILFNRTNSFEHVGRTGIFDLEGDYCFASYLIRLIVAKSKANPFFVNAFMNSDSFQQGIKQFASRAIGQSNINAKNLSAYRIPLPPLDTQFAIVTEIEAEQALVNANRDLVARMEKKIQATLALVWGEDEITAAEA
jgi:type I restriction enzyme M protein